MIAMTLILEDTVLHVTEFMLDNPKRGSSLQVTCTDQLTGKFVIKSMTYLELAAILALAFAGDTLPEQTNNTLYEIAEPVVKEWPIEVRPIP